MESKPESKQASATILLSINTKHIYSRIVIVSIPVLQSARQYFDRPSWSRHTTKSASEALLEVVANILDTYVGRVALTAALTVANIITATRG